MTLEGWQFLLSSLLSVSLTFLILNFAQLYFILDLDLHIPPLVGGVIGYVTNDIAIRMLFRPHTAKHIMGWRVPFTPGIIPKEKGRIAEAVGTAISDNIK